MDALKNSDHGYAEIYTARLAPGSIDNLESMINKPIEILTREQTEQGEELFEKLYDTSKTVSFLVPGDPMTATTHVDLLLRAKKAGIETSVIHGPSVATVVPGLLGLQFYKFGRTTTLAYPEGDYFPESPYDIIADNKRSGLHSLVLLDIHADEERYMTANEGIQFLLKINSKRQDDIFNTKTLTCVVARAGSDQPKVAAHEAGKLLKMDFGEPMHSIVIPGKLHFKESEALIVLANAPKELF